MKRAGKAERLVLGEIAEAARKVRQAGRGLKLGQMIAMIRRQLGMSQSALARRAGCPQSTISRLEGSKGTPNIATLQKVMKALSCDLLIVPVLMEPVEAIRLKAAQVIAERNGRYLQGNLNADLDKKLKDELIQDEVHQLLASSGKNLWS